MSDVEQELELTAAELGLDMNNPAEACLAPQDPIYPNLTLSLQQRLDEMHRLAEATTAILKFHRSRLSPVAQKKSDDLVQRYRELNASLGPWSNIRYRLGFYDIGAMEREFYAVHQRSSIRLSQALDGDQKNAVDQLNISLQANLGQMGTSSQRKFCQYLDTATKEQGHTLPLKLLQTFNGFTSETANVSVNFAQSIGGGSFGAVYEGTVPSNSRLLAVKFPDRERTADNELDHESKVWRLLKHRNILPLLGICEMGPFIGLISPWVSSTSWKYSMLEFTSAQNISFLREIADALAYMHRLEIIHGDIKADNVLIDSTPAALLCDFGLSLQRKSDASRASQKGSGSGIHKDPNLVTEGKYQPKNRSSDVWAFSMTIVHVLDPTGRLPMSDEGSDDSGYLSLYHRIVNRGERPEPSPDMTHAAKTTWRIAERCWTIKGDEKEPIRRPSMSFILELLREVEHGACEDVEAKLKEWDRSPSSSNDVQDVIIPVGKPRHSRIVSLTNSFKNAFKRP